MICPRCGYPGISPCKLCGQDDYVEFELNRFTQKPPGRLEFTVVIPQIDLNKHKYDPANKGVKYAVTKECAPGVFFFFDHNSLEQLSGFLESVRHIKTWSLLVNGRLRPFSQELWLPLLEMVIR